MRLFYWSAALSLAFVVMIFALIRSDDFVQGGADPATRVVDGYVEDTRITPHGRVHADWFDQVTYFPFGGGPAERVCSSWSDPDDPGTYDDEEASVIRFPLHDWFPKRCDLSRPGRYNVLSKRWVRPLFGLNILGLDVGATRLFPVQWQWHFEVPAD